MTTRGSLILLGAGGHAAVVADAAQAAGWIVLGTVCDDDADDSLARTTLPSLGTPDDLPTLLAHLDVPPGAVHAAVGDASVRRRWVERWSTVAMPPIVHPSAVVSPSAQLEDAVFIGPRAVVNARAVVSRGTIVNSGAIVEHDAQVGPYAHIAPGAVLGGAATVGAAALIGLNATVLPRVHIGAGACLGAGSTAIRDIPDGITAVGQPAGVLQAAEIGPD